MVGHRTPREIFDAYEDGILVRAEMFARMMEALTPENAEEVRRDLGRMAPAFETWIDLSEHGGDVVLAGRVVPTNVMRRVSKIWRALPAHG